MAEKALQQQQRQLLQLQQPLTPHLGPGVRTGRWGRALGPGQRVSENARNKVVCLEFFVLTARKHVKKVTCQKDNQLEKLEAAKAA